jgi:hypothetical protein
MDVHKDSITIAVVRAGREAGEKWKTSTVASAAEVGGDLCRSATAGQCMS